MESISYKKGYKYQLKESYVCAIPIKPAKDVGNPYIQLTTEGKLTIKEGYAWDGPSGPTFDTLTFMRGSLVHDALYQLMREEMLDFNKDRDPADRLLQKHCREDGMFWLRAQWVYYGLRFGGRTAADPANKKPVIKAPKT